MIDGISCANSYNDLRAQFRAASEMEAACYSTTEAVFAATEQSSLDADMNNLSASARSALARERLLNTNMDPHDIGEPSRGSSSASHASTSHNTPSLLELNISNQWNGIPVQTHWVSTYVDKDWRYLKFPGAHGVYAFQFVSDRAVRNALGVVNVGGGQKYTPYMVPYSCVECKGKPIHEQLCISQAHMPSSSAFPCWRVQQAASPSARPRSDHRAGRLPPLTAVRAYRRGACEPFHIEEEAHDERLGASVQQQHHSKSGLSASYTSSEDDSTEQCRRNCCLY